jgi:hypothetical protein
LTKEEEKVKGISKTVILFFYIFFVFLCSFCKFPKEETLKKKIQSHHYTQASRCMELCPGIDAPAISLGQKW